MLISIISAFKILLFSLFTQKTKKTQWQNIYLYYINNIIYLNHNMSNKNICIIMEVIQIFGS